MEKKISTFKMRLQRWHLPESLVITILVLASIAAMSALPFTNTANRIQKPGGKVDTN